MASAFWRRVTVVDIASQALARSGVGAEFRCLGFSCGGGDDGDGGGGGDGGDSGDGGGRVTTAATVVTVTVMTATVVTVMTATGAAKNRTPLW